MFAVKGDKFMFVIKGKSVYGGVAIGNIDVYNKKPRQVVRYKVSDTAAEIKQMTATNMEALFGTMPVSIAFFAPFSIFMTFAS